MGKLNLSKMVCVVFVFCAAAVIASPGQTLTTLHSFDNTDGANPFAGLVQATDGNFYGTTYSGGANLSGVVFKITPSGTLTTLHSFCSQSGCADGALPAAGLIQATDGNLYGTTVGGGANNRGTVFKITPSGVLTILYSFCNLAACADGSAPEAGLVLATNGNLYGTTEFGGKYSFGAIFVITPSGMLTTLYSFCAEGDPCPDGARPTARLVQAVNGNFYGTTQAGGANRDPQCAVEGCGTVFEFTGVALTTLYSFCPQSGCPDGQTPVAGLIQATDGNFYGTTYSGGAHNNNGTVFKITPSGTLTTLHSFCSQSSCTDGQAPYAGLLQASDGNLYGTTVAGGNGGGTIFKITLGGTLTTIYVFCSQSGCSDGESPNAALIQGTNGDFYGTTFIGGAHGYGAVFSLGPAQFVPVTPCRVVDTRNPNGTFGGPPIQGGTYRNFPIPQGSCNIPASAVAYSLNVTVVPQTTLGYLTIWPTGEGQPMVSTLNSPDGRVKANAAIIPAGTPSGSVSVYVTNTTNVVLDIDGYFAPVSGQTLAFYPLTPCRVADTRDGTKPSGLGPPQLFASTPRSFPVENSPCIPTGVNPRAYSFNFTVVPIQQHRVGYLSVWPTGQTQPGVSTLNDQTGTIVANAAIVPAGTSGAISVFATDGTQLLIDIDGYFAPAGQGGLSLYALTPCRVIDTRHVGSGQPFSGELTVDVVGSMCAPPSTARAYVFNATVLPVGSLGFLTLWPNGQSQPVVSTLNATDGAITSNMAIVPAGTSGKVDAYANGLTQLLLDISSYFAP